jgi:predicted AAA+ superfamily ATPase
MAMNNRDRVGKGLELLSEGLYDIVDEVMTREFGSSEWNRIWAESERAKFGAASSYVFNKNDIHLQLRALTEKGVCFKSVLSRSAQSHAQELREFRNAWAHNEPINSDDAIRALDTMERLLKAADSLDSAEDVRKLRDGLQRSVAQEQTRNAVRHHVDLPTGAGLKPWRDVIMPHDDVASGNYNASEYAADLYQVANNLSSSEEYLDPIEFFNRTFITEGLNDLLTKAITRLVGDDNAAPVINLQTNFGGGKTHSLMALFHLFGGTPNARFPQEVQEIIARCSNPDVNELEVRRVVLVGTYLDPGKQVVKPDGTLVNTIWGELAWQLGGHEAFELVADADRTGMSPGDALRVLIERYSPCLILIDEWVAYARQLVGVDSIAGSFESQFTFAQHLTEVIKATPRAMLVVSIPASDTGSSETVGNDNEIGGERGQAALARLLNVTGRIAEQWLPSNKDESFEIVKRRLFQEPDSGGINDIHVTARAFVDFYQTNSSAFPREASDLSQNYAKRIIASYPLHPEFFDRLYEDWSTLERFQRTRGVLKLVSNIVHALWDSDDNAPLIMPSSIPLDDSTVNAGLTQYLEDSWKPIIDADIDGDNSTAAEIDRSRSNLGQRHMTRRVARTIFMGTAPITKGVHRGLDKQRIWLGTAIPGDPLGNFSTALEQLAQQSTYFYNEEGKYWFDTQPSITKTARERAEQLGEDLENAYVEIVKRLVRESQTRSVFSAIHVAPESSGEITDQETTRLVFVHPRFAKPRQQTTDENLATSWIDEVVSKRATGYRQNRNTLVFLVADASMLASLISAVYEYLGWEHVDKNSDSLNLSPQQKKQAESRVVELDDKVNSRLREAYVWVAYPKQMDTTAPFTIEYEKVSESAGQSLAERAAEKLFRSEQLIRVLAPSILGLTLRKELAGVWKHGDLSVGDLWAYFVQYPYMPRLLSRDVLDRAVDGALNAIGFETIVDERFALASGKDEQTGKYVSLVLPPSADALFQVTDSTLLVDWDAAVEQRDAAARAATLERAASLDDGARVADDELSRGDASVPEGPDAGLVDASASVAASSGTAVGLSPVASCMTRYFGSVRIDPSLYAKDFGTIGYEIIERLKAIGAKLEISLEIQATKTEGFSEGEIRTIKENSNSLKFDNAGFEEE